MNSRRLVSVPLQDYIVVPFFGIRLSCETLTLLSLHWTLT